MDATGVGAVLGKTELLGGLATDDLERVASIVEEVAFPASTPVFARGDLAHDLYVVVEGSVRIFVEDPRGEITLGVVGPFHTFGEMALFDAGPRAASAETVDPTTLLTIRRASWVALLELEPALVRHVLHALGVLVRRYAHQAVECLFLDLEGRVARLLLLLAERLGRREEPMRLDLELTQGEIAHMVHGSRQSVNQVLHRLEAGGSLRVEGGEIVILDRALLGARATL